MDRKSGRLATPELSFCQKMLVVVSRALTKRVWGARELDIGVRLTVCQVPDWQIQSPSLPLFDNP